MTGQSQIRPLLVLASAGIGMIAQDGMYWNLGVTASARCSCPPHDAPRLLHAALAALAAFAVCLLGGLLNNAARVTGLYQT